MKEYTKEFDGVTYTFTEGDLSEPFSYVLRKLKADIVDAKKLMGSRYTEDIDNKVQSLIDDFIDSSFECQLKIMRNTLESSKRLTLSVHLVMLWVLVNTLIGISEGVKI